MYREKQEANYKILYQTIYDIIIELYYRDIASFKVYKQLSNSLIKYNLWKHEWETDGNMNGKQSKN